MTLRHSKTKKTASLHIRVPEGMKYRIENESQKNTRTLQDEIAVLLAEALHARTFDIKDYTRWAGYQMWYFVRFWRKSEMVVQEYLNLKETAIYIGRSYRAIKKNYRSWEMLGIIPSRRPGEREVFFKRTDLDLLHEKTKIIQLNERAGRKCAVL